MAYQIEMTEERKKIFRDMGQAVQALEILGEKKFLSGISRSAYHYTAARETEDGEFVVYFDSSVLFR